MKPRDQSNVLRSKIIQILFYRADQSVSQSNQHQFPSKQEKKLSTEVESSWWFHTWITENAIYRERKFIISSFCIVWLKRRKKEEWKITKRFQGWISRNRKRSTKGDRKRSWMRWQFLMDILFHSHEFLLSPMFIIILRIFIISSFHFFRP